MFRQNSNNSNKKRVKKVTFHDLLQRSDELKEIEDDKNDDKKRSQKNDGHSNVRKLKDAGGSIVAGTCMAPVFNDPYAYARSLARFAADLGPVAWKVASRKIEAALPPGTPYGPGWVGVLDEVIQETPQLDLPLSLSQQTLPVYADHPFSNASKSMPTRLSNPEPADHYGLSKEMIEAVRKLNDEQEAASLQSNVAPSPSSLGTMPVSNYQVQDPVHYPQMQNELMPFASRITSVPKQREDPAMYHQVVSNVAPAPSSWSFDLAPSNVAPSSLSVDPVYRQILSDVSPNSSWSFDPMYHLMQGDAAPTSSYDPVHHQMQTNVDPLSTWSFDPGHPQVQSTGAPFPSWNSPALNQQQSPMQHKVQSGDHGGLLDGQQYTPNPQTQRCNYAGLVLDQHNQDSRVSFPRKEFNSDFKYFSNVQPSLQNSYGNNESAGHSFGENGNNQGLGQSSSKKGKGLMYAPDVMLKMNADFMLGSTLQVGSSDEEGKPDESLQLRD